jgi:hypothetical protein
MGKSDLTHGTQIACIKIRISFGTKVCFSVHEVWKRYSRLPFYQ